MSFRHRGGGGRRGGGGGGYAYRGRGRECGHSRNLDPIGTASRSPLLSDVDSEGGHGPNSVFNDRLSSPSDGFSASALSAFLADVDGQNYSRLKQLTGQTYRLTQECFPHPASVTVRFLRIQPDPFAPGSQLCVSLPAPFSTRVLLQSTAASPPVSTPTLKDGATTISEELVAWRRVAAEDFLLRCVHRGLDNVYGGVGSAVQLLQVSQHVLPRSTVQLVQCPDSDETSAVDGYVQVFLRVKLPGHGRRIDSEGIRRILFRHLLPAFQRDVARCDHAALWQHVTSVCDQEWLRRQLKPSNLVAFIADGAVLPRAAGDSDRPLSDGSAVPFQSPPSLAKSFQLPFSGRTLRGAALPKGLTLIAGGGFHGKSTLLRALELGVYNHVPDDGRAFVVVDPTAVKIRAEDRRAVSGVDISPFIRNLPFRKDTTAFSTGDASGSTSQAANIMEALELGSTALLLDEDTSATNFMYRDALMEQLVPPTQEPITSFVHRVQDLMRHHEVSVIMVVGGSGQYFPMADVVLVMNAYHVHDATAQARAIVEAARKVSKDGGQKCTVAPGTPPAAESAFHFPPQRHLQYNSTFEEIARRARQGPGRGGLKVSGTGTERVRVGHEEIELALVEQLVEEGQLNAIAQCIAMLYDDGSAAAEALQHHAAPSPMYPPPLWSPSLAPLTTPAAPTASTSLSSRTPAAQLARVSDYCQLIRSCESRLRSARMELQTQSCYLPAGFTALPRVFELGAALNRLRTLITSCR